MPLSIDVSDIDLDGRIDVAIGHSNTGGDVNNNPAITLLRNFHNGTFASIDTSYVQPAYVETIKFAKMNEDNYPDLVITHGEYHDATPHHYMRVFYNNMGYYDAPTDHLLTTIWNTTYFWFTCADVNGDGLDDPAFASNPNDLWTAAINLGNNQFSEPISMNLGFSPQAITNGDLTGDGIDDILISGWPLTMFSYINGTWHPTIIDNGGMASESAICDIDNDGDNDIVTYLIPPMGDDCTLRIYENQNGQFSLRFQRIYSFPSGLSVFDYNNDNLPDFLLANKLVTNLGNFTFSEPKILHYSTGGNPKSFADLDHNGYLDILAIAYDYENNRGLLYLNFNDGNGNFLPYPPTENIDDTNINPPHIQLSSFPNPFKTTVTISYTLPKVYAEGKISIFNIKGERVKTISINSKMSNVLWDGTDEHKKTVASGIYFYRLVTDTNISKTHKMLMLK
ncbi:MAG: FG-GAP-like repeat-containing protein [Candidatus Cloacimonadaceae bacterium]|nr:FG-GAP-like repeat-containing protein [Candidatus Cloacimonadaceae bacterium]